MRLICPNCGAQYEVPDEVIPESGRDVQCSDCGDTWFQCHPKFPPELEDTEEETVSDWIDDTASEPESEPEKELEPEPEDEPEWQNDALEDLASAQEDVFAVDDAPDRPATSEGPTRRELDPSIRDVLRAEAEREEEARRTEMGGGLETQQELGIDETDSETERRNQEARARIARLRGLPDTDPEGGDENDDIDPSSRRNLLPDIEEINSSLGPEQVAIETARAREADEGAESPEKSGFRLGFRISIVLILVGLIVYVFAPQMAETVPALTPLLSSYVELVNSGRSALAEMVENFAG